MFEKKHLIEDLVCLLLGIFLGIILFYFLKTSISLKDSFDLIVGIATIATLFGILLAKKSLDSTIESINVARESLEEARKNTEIAQKNFDNLIETQKEEKDFRIKAIINSLLEELKINFNICNSSFFKRFDWKQYYCLFSELKDTKTLYYVNPTADINEDRNLMMQMLKIFYENTKKYEVIDVSQKEFIQSILTKDKYYLERNINLISVESAISDHLSTGKDIQANIRYLIWRDDLRRGSTNVVFEDDYNKRFLTSLNSNAIESILTSGLLLSWGNEYRNRLFANLSELNFSIKRFNDLKNEYSKDNLVLDYIIWTHFRLVFLILDILEIFKDKKEIFVNTNFVNEVYNQIGI